MTLSDLEADHYITPHGRLEFLEFQKLTSKFCKYCKNKEQKELTREAIFELISDNPTYQDTYKRMISENDTREALRIFLSTDLSVLEDKKVLMIARSWRVI